MKFSIRDLLLVTVIVALAMGWWVERSRLQRENSVLVRDDAALKVQFLDEHNHRLAASADASTRRELQAEMIEQIEQMKRSASLPNSSAPTPKPPKN